MQSGSSRWADQVLAPSQEHQRPEPIPRVSLGDFKFRNAPRRAFLVVRPWWEPSRTSDASVTEAIRAPTQASSATQP